MPPRPNALSPATLKLLITYQRQEETDHLIYSRMAAREKNPANKATLQRIAADEKDHSAVWRRYTRRNVAPSRAKVFWYSLMALIMGYTFAIKLMEKGEYTTGRAYEKLLEEIPEARRIMEQEQEHEEKLVSLLDEERLQYVGAMVLGLNDALVELTGTLAGLSFAMADTRLVALSGVITGTAATLSMAASNYLAERAGGNPKALKSSLYTGVAYLITVVVLVLPYLLFPSNMYLAAFGAMLAFAVLIILAFNYYTSVAQSLPFLRRFGQMAAISLGVAALSFVIGLAAKALLGVSA